MELTKLFYHYYLPVILAGLGVIAIGSTTFAQRILCYVPGACGNFVLTSDPTLRLVAIVSVIVILVMTFFARINV